MKAKNEDVKKSEQKNHRYSSFYASVRDASDDRLAALEETIQGELYAAQRQGHVEAAGECRKLLGMVREAMKARGES